MEVDLVPKSPKKIYEGDGGSYQEWCPSDLPMLTKANIGAAKLSLAKYGFTLPSYSDSSKIAYVLQGNGVAGMVQPESEEKLLPLKKGDAIAIPMGFLTWWFNKQDTHLVILLLGDTSKSQTPGLFTDFFLTGSNSIFTAFSPEFTAMAWDIDEPTANYLTTQQPGVRIVKLTQIQAEAIPEPKEETRDGLVLNCEEAPMEVDISKGGRVVVVNEKKLPLVGKVGVGADLVRVDGGAMCSPGFSCDSALQVTYIVKGGGRVEVAGGEGKKVMESRVEEGKLFIVPRFCPVSKICDPCGMEWFSMVTTPDPVFSHLAGRTSVWKALSPAVIRAAFNVSEEMEERFRASRITDEIFFPPKSTSRHE